jgi:hypothetical protein
VKATIDLPDDLYQRVAAESARQKRPMDAVVAELLQRSLDDNGHAAELPVKPARYSDEMPIEMRRQLSRNWLEEWLHMGEEAAKNAPPGPSAREILEEGRDRLERR